VIGGGAWGTAFSRLLADRGHEVTLVCRDPAQAAAIEETGRNPRTLSTVDLRDVDATAEAPPGADLYVLAVPSAAFSQVAGGLPTGGPVLSLTKGLDPATGNRLSTLIRDRPVAVLSGPNMAEEIAQGLPGAAVIAGEDEELAVQLQHAINSMVFRVYVNADLVGVELCAAAKNVIGLAAGGVDGLGLGDNGKAALITRGLVEMARLGEACGARPETFAGLAGMGDLIAQGVPPDEAAAQIGHVVEGLTTAPVLRDLSRRLGIELPITEGVCRILEGEDLGDLVASLMGRRPRGE
jgi:glycerol-3-phosphate dehydrogenase (NAD(P)+)